ncbi:hypothetical protein JOH52_002828 [Sinorhizobium meliloti]|nr:putative phage abortive infection protein [Sinorhizobium meliloti]MBP2466807.1 hypothetical protein [Sinorhizobium meliloti]MDE3765753.1 putative phage abortive infection protein [Sinorhizobium meliloti]MDE3781623.1 putative phage abortive infection protein [Sinorhizobium meliloti]MDE3783785.1 putative phage abortive infection protein [Sinorhizobium meliloti]MDE3803615.1 putative phage abortive infection protein [Sinorhizobium meliloti]
MRLKWIVAAAIGFGAVWIAWVFQEFVFQWFDIPWKSERLGQLGDTFGALNALFSALAFVAVLFTIKQQADDLRRQQRQIFKAEQNQHRQRFEDNFFQLLAVIRENRQDVRFRNSDKYLTANVKAVPQTKKGHFAFRAAYREMRYWVRQEDRAGRALNCEGLAALYAKKVHVRYESTLGAYFRLVYETLDRVDRDPFLSDEEKDEFGNLVRGQMTSFEAAIAGCNALNDFAKDFKRLVIRFRLLKYARTGDVYDELTKHYPPETFQGRDTNRPPEPDIDDDVDEDWERDE